MMRRMNLLILAALLAALFSLPMRGYAQNTDPTATPASVIAPIITVTPRADGSLVHVVGFGQTLAEIAKTYGVKIEDIQRLNGLPPDSTTLYSGQKLLIIPKGAPFVLLTATATSASVLQPTEQSIPTQLPGPAAPTRIAPAAAPNEAAMILPLAGGLILLGGCLLLVAAFAIQRRK